MRAKQEKHWHHLVGSGLAMWGNLPGYEFWGCKGGSRFYLWVILSSLDYER